jgi:flagellar motor switch protein FliG
MRKAATLLLSLDPDTAAELVKSAGPDTIKEIATEMASLQAEGAVRRAAPAQPVREFLELLRQDRAVGSRDRFLKQMLSGAVGPEQSDQLLTEVGDLVHRREPFLDIRSADVARIAKAMEGESAQMVSVVLAELPPNKSAKLLELLDERVRVDAVRGLTAGRASPEARLRVADMVRGRLEAMGEQGEVVEDDQHTKLRKTAVLLRGMEPSVRDVLLDGIAEKDPDMRDGVESLMVIWEDIATLMDRPLQDVLRNVDSRKLALALVDADETTVAKIRSNMSERASAMLDEEASLLSTPKPKTIAEAREAILDALRELNAKGELAFENEEKL